MSGIWYGLIATGVITLGIGYLLLRKKAESDKRRDEAKHKLQLENEERRLVEQKRAEWRKSSEPLRNKLAAITMGGNTPPKLDEDDYLPVSHMFEDAGEGVEFILQCDAYNTLLMGYESEGDSVSHDEECETEPLMLADAARKIQVLLERQIGHSSD